MSSHSADRKASPERKRISVSGKERKWVGPRFDRRKNVPVLEAKRKHGPEIKMATQMAQIPIPMYKPKKQAMTVYDYLDMSKMVGDFEDDELGRISGFSTFRSQFAGDFTYENAEMGIDATGMDMNGSHRASSPADSQPTSRGSALGGDPSRPDSPSSVNDGVRATSASAVALDEYPDETIFPDGSTAHWHIKQKILANHWQVIQRWEAQARESGSLVGISQVGRKLQKIHPSQRVRIPGVDSPEPKLAQPSLESLGLQCVDTVAEFANLSKWQMGFNNPENKLAHLRCVQTIVVRESLLLQLDKTLEDIEQKYYEYALLRMQSADLGIPVNSEQLVVKKAVVLKTQVELRVALANYRTATIQVFDELIKWRNICRKDANIKDANIVLLWHGENYLLRMTYDISKLYRYSVLRLWLDFEPNMLMLPPQQLAASNAQINNMALAHISSGASVDSSLSGNGNNINNSFFGLPGQLPPLGGAADDDLMSQVSEGSKINYRTHFQARANLFADWLSDHETFLAAKRQEFLKKRRVDEQIERDLKNAQEMVDHEAKRVRQARASERYDTEEKEKREKNFKILKMHQQRVDAGEDADQVKETKTKEETDLDAAEIALKEERNTIERAIQVVENEEKAKRDAAYKEERDLKAKLQRELEESRFDVGIAAILTGSAPLIEANIPMNDGKEWQLLRNVCLASWRCTSMPDKTVNEDGTVNFYGYDDSEPKTVWKQGVDVARTFWSNYDVSPLVVEAATGFRELWPRDAVVPPLPEKLFRTCSEYRRFFALEKRKFSKLQDRKYGGQSLREKVAMTESLVYFDTHGLMQDQDQDQTMANNTGSLTSSKVSVRMDDDEDLSEVEQQKLRKRQESDGNLVDGTLRIYREIANLNPKKIGEAPASLRSSRSGANGKYQMLKFNTVTLTQSTDNLFTNSTTVQCTESLNGDDGQGGDTFAMTRAEEMYDEGYSYSNPLSPGVSDPLQNTQMDTRPVPLTGTMHPTGLDAIAARPLKMSESTVANERWLVGRDKFGIPIIRPEQAHRRPPDFTRPYWQYRLTVRIQSVIRGFCCRLRLMRARHAVHVMKSIVKIQSAARRRIGWKLYLIKKEQFQIGIEIDRRIIIKKHNSALTITQFVRHCGSINTGAVAMNPMLAYAKSAAKARAAANAKKQKRGMDYAQTTTITNADGSMTVKRIRSPRSRSLESSPNHSRSPSRGGNSRCGSRGRACSPTSRGTTSYGQATAGEFGPDLVDATSSEDKKEKVKLANIFKSETRNGSRLIPITVKPGSLASQPGTRKPRFRPFRALSREFMQDVHLPPAEKTVKHPNDCYRAPPALLTAKEREVIAKELAAREAIENEDGVAIINKAKLDAMKETVRAAMQRKL